jgi:hypothetical protein
VREVKKKVLVIAVALMAVAMLATPLVQAVPGAEKSNEKFEYFELVCSGTGSEVWDRFWYTPPNADALDNKTTHGRGGGWITGPVVELTVGSDTYTMTTTPVSVTWTTMYDMELVRNNDGTIKRVNIRLTDVLTVYENDVEIGTLVLKLKSAIVPTASPVYGGNVVGYGTGALKGVHISAIDLGLVSAPPPIYVRVGTITGWPL